jgi:hypothetical protein
MLLHTAIITRLIKTFKPLYITPMFLAKLYKDNTVTETIIKQFYQTTVVDKFHVRAWQVSSWEV